MMNFRLAEKLMRSGFPQRQGFKVAHNKYFPFLEEIIDECGDDLEHLERVGNKWEASGHSQGEYHRTHFKSIYDTVAHFWLMINQK